MSFEFTVSNTDVFLEIFASTSLLAKEVELEFSPSGIYFCQLESSEVMLITIAIKKEFFKDYTCEKKISVGMQTKAMVDVLKHAEKCGAVKISFDESLGNFLTVFILNPLFSERHILKIIDFESVEFTAFMEEPNPVKIAIESSLFWKTINAMQAKTSDCITLTAQNGSIVFTDKDRKKAKKHSSGYKPLSIIATGRDVGNRNYGQKLTYEFNISYIIKLIPFSKIAKEVIIDIKEGDVPLAVGFVGVEGLIVNVYIAPLVEST